MVKLFKYAIIVSSNDKKTYKKHLKWKQIDSYYISSRFQSRRLPVESWVMTRKLIILKTQSILGWVFTWGRFQILGIQVYTAQNLCRKILTEDYTVYVYNWRPNFSGVSCVNQLKCCRFQNIVVGTLSNCGKTLKYAIIASRNDKNL